MRILILDDDKIFGNILCHQISELTNRQWVCHFIQDNNNIADLLSRVDIILIDKNLDNCKYDSQTTIHQIHEKHPNLKIIMISGSQETEKQQEIPFILKDESIAKNITSMIN